MMTSKLHIIFTHKSQLQSYLSSLPIAILDDLILAVLVACQSPSPFSQSFLPMATPSCVHHGSAKAKGTLGERSLGNWNARGEIPRQLEC